MAGRPIEADRAVRLAERTGAENESETMDELCQRVSDGDSLKVVCKDWDVPYGKVAAWLIDDPARAEKYATALRLSADALAAEALEIADTTEAGTRVKETADGTETVTEDMLGHRKLRIETRLKLASKWDRARYGDSLQVQHSGETVVRLTFGGGGPVVPALVGESSVVEPAEDDMPV